MRLLNAPRRIFVCVECGMRLLHTRGLIVLPAIASCIMRSRVYPILLLHEHICSSTLSAKLFVYSNITGIRHKIPLHEESEASWVPCYIALTRSTW